MIFFRKSVKNESKLYARIRDYKGDFLVKSQIENMWEKYESLAPQKFLDKIQNNQSFHQRWWEMFLAIGLLNLNFKIITSPTDKGPDFKINLPSQIMNIEAVAPNIGNTDEAVPELLNGVHNFPEKELLLRITNSLESKLKVFNNYLEKGIVAYNDLNVIAISSCALNQFGSLMDFPAPILLKVLAGIGNLVLSKRNNYFQNRNTIKKESGNFVDTNLFNLENYSKICAVLYSHSSPLNSPDKPEITFQLFLNPSNSKNTNNILLKSFYGIIIWHQTINDNHIIWQKYKA